MTYLYNFLRKYGPYLVMGASLLILAIFFVNVNSGFSAMGFDSNTDLIQHKKEIEFFNFPLKAGMVMVVIAALFWILFGIAGLFTNFRSSIKFLVSFAVIIVLYFVFYNSAEVESSGRLFELLNDPNYHINADITKHISAGLKTMLSLFGLSIVALIISEVLSFFK